MTNGPDQNIALSEEIRNLKEHVAALEQRIANLEGKAPKPAVAAVVPPRMVQSIEDQRIESRLGLLWVNRIGALTLALGVLFLFKYAIDKQWITIWGRVGLGLFAGVALAAFSEWLRTRDQRVFSQGVFGCGVAVFYISLYFGFDEFRGAHPSTALTVSLIAILFALLLWAAIRWIRSILLVLNTAWAVGCTALILHHGNPDGFAWAMAVMAIVYFVLSGRMVSPAPLQRTMYLLGHGCLLVAVIQFLVTRIQHDVVALNRPNVTSESLSFLFALYAVGMIVIGFVRHRPIDRLLALGAIGFVVIKLYFYDVWLLDRLYRISAFVALGILLLSASYLYSRWKDKLDLLWSTGSDQ